MAEDRSRWRDLEARLLDVPGALASFAEVLGRAGVSLEGGGVTACGAEAVAHFLVDRPDDAIRALAAVGTRAVTREVVTLRLAQDVPGQLGLACRRMADAGVDVRAQYSDHDGRLVLVVDDPDGLVGATAVAAAWEAERGRL